MSGRARGEHLVVFDLNVGGHHGGYLHHVTKRWLETRERGRLSLVTSPQLPGAHPEVAALVEGTRAGLVPVTEAELAAWKGKPGGGRLDQSKMAMAEWRLLTQYAHRLRAGRALVMYLDRLIQLPLALGLRAPCPVAGIYFRPSFHYPELNGERMTGADRLRALRQKAALWRAVANPTLETVYSLDPYIVPKVEAWPLRRSRIVALPDPVDVPEVSPVSPEVLRARLGVPPGRKLCLLFGVLTSRKGLYPLLESLRELPREATEGMTLVLAGPVGAGDRERLEASLLAARAASPVDIRLEDGFVSETEAQAWFDAADVILAPYQKHVGMSGIVVRAAAAGRPVLASDYGLMGEVVRRNRLGVTVDAASPRAIASALAQMIAKPGAACDPASMRAFAAANTPTAFGDALLDRSR